ncbi:discoidin domain-containing protein [Cohnella algarum]|nr:discoidin domain-containing protein [Cohnella algarum]
MGSTRKIDAVKIYWEAAYGRSYQIQTSTDGANWQTVFGTTAGDGGRTISRSRRSTPGTSK